MKVTLVCHGRFHHFHLARQLERHGVLKEIITGYPRFKLKDEQGIPSHKIITFPYFQASYMFALSKGLGRYPRLQDSWSITAQRAIDMFASQRLDGVDVVVGLSGAATRTGQMIQAKGGKFVCDRGSSHINYQSDTLIAEYERWGVTFKGIDSRVSQREQLEYAIANRITVPSDFVYQSFIQKGIQAERISKVPYGARLDRFKKVAEPDDSTFTVLWVGGVSIRKGFFDALDAFRQLRHPGKCFRVIGAVEPAVAELLQKYNLDQVKFEGIIANSELPLAYSTAHVFVLPSLEEGLAMVQGEALACGCPVIASENTGGRDLFTHGIEGFEVPIRSPSSIYEKLQLLADNSELREQMSDSALKKVKRLGGWDCYGDCFFEMLHALQDE